MKKYGMVSLTCLALLAGCAAADRQAESEESKLQRETDQRLRTLEQSLSMLDTRVAQLDNRVYEVRTSRGKKTGMSVVPIVPPQPVTPSAATAGTSTVGLTAHGPTPTPPAAASTSTPPQGRAIVPHASPQKKKTPPRHARTPSTALQRPAADTSSVQAMPSTPLGLPPETVSTPSRPPVATASTVPTPARAPARAKDAAVPVPAMASSDLALPPEKTDLGLPPVDATPQPAATAAPATTTRAATAATPRRRSKGEDAAYKEAVRPALAGRAGESIPRFQSFLQEYPDGQYAANAEYWIGEGYYAQGNYREALAQFEKVNTRYPRHHKNADALLKRAMTLSKMGDKAGAAETYKKLLSEFPHSEAARRVRSQRLAR